MLIEKRKNLVNKFSSFISFTGDNSQNKAQLIWNIDFELEHKMKSNVEADPEAKEIFWAQYFLKVLLFQNCSDNQNFNQFNSECSFPTAKRHLSAYLQEACLKAAKDIHYEFRYIKHKYSLEECFQMANIAANSPGKFFRAFNFERNTINIESYAITAFKRFIRNSIYQQDLEARRTRISNYGLLKDLRAGELNDALAAQNFSNQQIILYRLVWQCFNEIVQLKPNGLSRTKKPSEKDFVAIASYYNQRCELLNLAHLPADDATIKEMLSICINIAKNYRNKQYFSLEENYYYISDDAPSGLNLLIQQEEWQEVQVIIDNLFTNMPELCQIIFKLWQGLNLTQAEIANLIKFQYPDLQKQYQIARQLQRYTRNILKEFAKQWNKINSEVYLNDEKDIKRIKSALEEYLKLYCKENLFLLIDKIIKEFSDEEKTRIFSCIKSENMLMNEQINSNLDSRFNLIVAIKSKFENDMHLEADSLSVVNYKIVDFVDEWIQIRKGEFL